VVTACVTLKRERRVVGLRNLRLELARGSYGTIAKCLRQLALVEILEGDSAPAVGGLVAGAAMALGLHEGLEQNRAIAVTVMPVVGQLTGASGQDL
jgi:hypothetical protein